MDARLDKLEWSLVESFLAVAEEGSLSAAARRLGLAQPTVGRQVRQLEAQLGFALFDRQPRGLRLTDKGGDLLGPARAMQAAASQLALAAAGASDELAGTVRITASVFTAQHALPQLIAEMRRDLPEIQIELVPNDSSENLLFREADIALRMYRSEQLEIVTRRVGDLRLGLYAARSYLDRVGYPETLEEVMALDWVGYDRSEMMINGMRDAGFNVSRDWFAVRCDQHAVYHQLLRAGCGVGFSQAVVTEADPQMVRLVPELPIPPLPLWLAAHETVRRVPRVALVWERLQHGLARYVA
ncbi:LysR family transcriptional regulator [Primorskyibacter sp. S187A]|uniref:LysR family transcriptional regulator n=1 Tax=Primorskyibacter sp. S187A TaxID=3415130 RepID=UPI003C7E25FC